ncbi:MAG: hypothetical protein WA708_13025 [Acidobacteriaceae bacterium]
MRLLWITVVLIPIAFSLYFALHGLRESWDDGAILAAYARTYADTGRIALTPSSPTVEGMSSLTWFLLLTVARFFSNNPDVILIWMKCASALSLVLALTVFFRVACEQLAGSEKAALGCTLMLAFSYTSFLEVKNGMEMNLAMLLTISLFYVLTRLRGGTGCLIFGWCIATLLLATRFESPLMLLLLAIGLYFDGDHRAGRPSHRGLFILAAGTLVSFGILELWRHHTFGVWMPNTVYAKEWPPYSRWHGQKSLTLWWGESVSAISVLFSALGIPLLIAFVVTANGLLRKHIEWASLNRVSKAVWTLSFGAFGVAWIIGKDWGYSGRMIVPMLPFLLIAIAALCRSALANKARFIHLLGGIVAWQFCLWFIVVIYASKPTVSIEEVRRYALGADAIRNALHKQTLPVMLPDVGGSALYGEHLRILDSALLSNPELAKHGWSYFGQYFHKTRPDAFETHSLWAIYQNAYNSNLLNDYSIVSANGKRFFVRNDLFAQLLTGKDGKIVPVDASSSCLGGPLPADIAFSRTRKVCLVLEPAAVAASSLPAKRTAFQ